MPDAGLSLQLMDTFVCIVEARSLSAAAMQLGTSQPTVSRRLQALEEHLGVRLLQRSTHVMQLTVDGERCFARAKELLANWSAFEADLRGTVQEPQGYLRVAVPHAFGQDKFVVPLAQFLTKYPLVSVEWLLRDEVQDYIAERIDCAIQVGMPTDPAVIAIKLTEVPRIMVAAPSLLVDVEHSYLDAVADLPWLSLKTYYRNELSLTEISTGESKQLLFRTRFITDSLYAIRSAALMGLGVCLGSSWVFADDLTQGRLVHLMPNWRAAPLPVYITYPRAQFYPARLQQFVSLMRDAVPIAMGSGLPFAQ